jgi:hypothetical protein
MFIPPNSTASEVKTMSFPDPEYLWIRWEIEELERMFERESPSEKTPTVPRALLKQCNCLICRTHREMSQ